MTGSSMALRASLVGLLALLLAALTPGLAAAQGDPTPDQDSFVDLDPVEVTDPDADVTVGYALAWSQFTFESADEVLVGRSDIYPDNLASGVLQGHGERPLLLTPTEELLDEVEDEIVRLGASTVYVLGETAAISADTEEEIAAIDGVDDVIRVGGLTRIQTAIEISELNDTDTVLIARGFPGDDETQAFADSLAGGAWAAADGYDLLFTQTEELNTNPDDPEVPGTREALIDQDYANVIILGGTAAVSQQAEDEIGEALPDANVTRVAGEDRYDTAEEIAEARGFETANDADVTVLTDGAAADAWGDAFSAAAFAGLHDAPLVLANSNVAELPAVTAAFLEGTESADDTTRQGDLPPAESTHNELDADVGLVCGPSVPDGEDDIQTRQPGQPADEGDQCGEAAELRGLNLRVGFPPDEEPPPTDDSGTVIDCTGDTVTFSVEGQKETVTVEYDTDDDTFLVDGDEATVGAFDAACSVGDQITVTEDEDGNLTLELTNVDPADINEGMVGNVDTSNDTFDIIDPNTGTILRPNVSYAGNALFTADGDNTTLAGFEGDISEGDTIVLTEGETGADPDTFALTNGAVEGTVSDSGPGLVLGTCEYQIADPLGDDPATGLNDTHFVADATDDLTVDGDDATLAEFCADLTDGDEATYSRAGGVETHALTNAAPTPTAGDSTEASNTGTNTLVILPFDSATPETFVYSNTAQFRVNGAVATVAEFEARLSPGDDVSYTPADTPTGTPETVTLEDDDLAGVPDNADTVNDQYDVENAEGGTIDADVDYTGDDLFVDGAVATEAAFETALSSCDTNADADCTIRVTQGVPDEEHRLDTDSTDGPA